MFEHWGKTVRGELVEPPTALKESRYVQERGNFFRDFPQNAENEHFEILLRRPGLRIERIVSHGHVSPPDFWYDQPEDEWVVVLRGSAIISYENRDEDRMEVGDWVLIPAHCRHRVSRTNPEEPTVWLAVYIDV